MKWIKGEDIGILGRPFQNAKPYYRLEDDDIKIMEKVHYDGMCFHPRCSSGLHIDFTTDSDHVYVKWEVVHCIFRSDVPISCESCIDCYIDYKNKWRYLSTCFIDQETKKAERPIYTIEANPILPKGNKTFSINLPTYDFIVSLEIGIDDNATIKGLKPKKEKPIVVYGTSITQGGHACRPGLSWPTWMRRKINHEVHNLGFSGSGKLEHEMTKILCKLDPKIMIMDCVANMAGGDEFIEKWEYFYSEFRKGHKNTPLLLIEQPTFSNYWTVFKGLEHKNKLLRKLYGKWIEKDKNLYYIKTSALYTSDGDGAVDGIHGTDASMEKMTKNISKKVLSILNK